MRRYFVELGGALAAYMLCLVVSLRWLAGQEGVEDGTGGALALAVSLAPVLPGLAVCWAVLRQMRRLDEMQRRLQLEALSLAFALTAILTFSYGFLENVGFPRLSMFAVLPLMAVLWTAGVLLGRLRYG
ncbi:hypothetical protein E0K89_017015 [Aquicoccus sp. SCR17]|nr:hypothetical protein [Carideicomes alvinocaridis]